MQFIRNSNVPELSSITLKKKLYNTRLQNKPEDMQQIISGTLKDITDITNLLLSLKQYRSETMNGFAMALGFLGQDIPTNYQDQGILGPKPQNVTSIAELILQDSDTNVYEERNVELPQTTVFNIRGKEKKVLSKKERQITDMRRRQAVQRELMKKQEKEKAEIIREQAPLMLNNKKRKTVITTNDMLFVR